MKNNKKRNLLLSLILAAVCIAFLLYVDKFQHYSMLATVLKKGAIYSLVAVSLNLLNGFTGLFSLGQAGFMMIGAYTYSILTIPVADRPDIYQYFDGGVVQFCLPMLVGLILAGIVPAIFAWLIGLPVLKLKSDYLAIATLGFAEIMRAIIQWKQVGPLTNASNLLKKFANFDSILFPFVVSAICIGFIVLLINSTYGRAPSRPSATTRSLPRLWASTWPSTRCRPSSSAPFSPVSAARCWPCSSPASRPIPLPLP